MTGASDAIAALVGQRILGGRDDCDAWQLVRQDGSPAFRLTVEHDVTCPWLAAYEARRR